MNPEKDFENWANKNLRALQRLLLLDAMLLHPIQPIESPQPGELAHSECLYPYKDIQIRYSPALVERWQNDPQMALGALVHEMFHPLTDGLYVKGCSRFTSKSDFEEEREGLVDHLANIVLSILRDVPRTEPLIEELIQTN